MYAGGVLICGWSFDLHCWSPQFESVGALIYNCGVLICGWVGRWSFDRGCWRFDFGRGGALILGVLEF